MKFYAEHERIKQYLLSHPRDGIHIVDSKGEANYLISGRYNELDYHRNLFGVIIPWTGHDEIDLEACKKENIKLFITPTRSKYVAEKAVTLTLALLGKTIQYHEWLKEGYWVNPKTSHREPWTSLQGKSVGLFGFGRIGRIVYQMLKGFDVNFYTIDRQKEYPSDVTLVKNLTNLVQMSDVVIISAPLNKETEGLFDEHLLNSMKNKFLINVGRGKIVEESSLYDALKNKNLLGYASDVWCQYPKGKEMAYPSHFPIYELDNVVLSGHSGGSTHNTNEEVNEDILRTLENIVNENFDDQLDIEKLI